MRPLKHLPKIAVTCPVVQFSIKTNGSPIKLGGSSYYFYSIFDFIFSRRKRRQNGPDLARVNAPHAAVAKAARLLRYRPHGGIVIELGDHAMRRHFAISMASRGNFQLGTHHQRVRELAGTAHAIG